MASIIPLIRSAVLVPWVRWLEANGIPPGLRLAEADLAYLPVNDPNGPVPLLNVFDFARRMAIAEGDDIGCRVVSNSTIEELANIGLVMRRGRTPHGALERTAAALPRHCTHEVIQVQDTGDGLLVSDLWRWNFDTETLHVVQQNVASIIECICKMTGRERPYFEFVRMLEHPAAGLDHLAGHFGCPLLPATQARLEVKIPKEVADAPFLETLTEEPDALSLPEDWTRLREGGALSASARIVLGVMLRCGTPTVERLASSAGMSVRTMQRRLGEEGTGFAQLLDEVRSEIAKERLSGGDVDAATVAQELGYSHPAALTRAVRRWTGRSPRSFRRGTSRERNTG
jgi:AraC-like DNA-binding protein